MDDDGGFRLVNERHDIYLDREYAKELNSWIASLKEKGKKQKEVADLTQYYVGKPDELGQKAIDSATVGRIIKERPINQTRGYSLLRILGVLFVFGEVSLVQIKEFLEKYEVPFAVDDTWEQQAARIEQGAQLAKQALLEKNPKPDATVSPLPPPEIKSSKRNIRPFVPVVLIVVPVLVVSIILLLTRQNSPQLNAALPCTQSFPETLPAFLPNQGFSQIKAVLTDLGSSILSNSIRSLGMNEDALWIGYLPTAGGIDRVSRYIEDQQQHSWVHSCLGLSLQASQNVNDFAFTNTGVFIATDGAGIGQFDGTQWRFYTRANGLLSDSVYTFSIMRNGELWAATYEGVVRFLGDRWEVVFRASPGGLASNHVLQILEDDLGNQWFGLGENGISRRDAQGTWYTYFNNDPNFGDVFGIVNDAQGGIWFGTNRSGLRRFYNNTWETLDVANNALLSDTIMDLDRDKFGRIWIATPRGVAYTADLGKTWETHSTMDTLAIEFGCATCIYNEDHIWLVLNEQGIGHVRIPPMNPVVDFMSVPELVQLRPGEKYVFEVVVRVISESFNESDGDSLRNIAPLDTFLFGAYPIIPVLGSVPEGQTYVFSNVDNPIEAPNEPGNYTLEWRVWQGRRFASEPIAIEFEVETE